MANDDVVNIYYDTEFHERAFKHPLDFISIGLVADTGDWMYNVHRDFDWDAAYGHTFLRTEVLPKLPNLGLEMLDESHPDVLGLTEIKERLTAFFAQFRGKKIKLWAYYSAYDHVILSMIFGRMLDLPAGVPMRTNCLKQMADEMGVEELPWIDPARAHHALYDAMHDREIHQFLLREERDRRIWPMKNA